MMSAIGFDFDPSRSRYPYQITCTTASNYAEKFICPISSGCGGGVDKIEGAFFPIHRSFEALNCDVTTRLGRLVERRSKNC